MIRHAAILASLLAALAAPALPARAGCERPSDLVDPGAALPATSRAGAAGTLRIVVAGSASVLGPGTSGMANAWPARLEAILRQRRPNLKIDIIARGGRGMTATDSAALIADELKREPADLVLWQTGTVEAVRGLPVDDLVEALTQGLEKLRAAGIDAVLIDPQFSRFLRANANVEPYRDAMRLVAAAQGVPLFRRFDLMRYWAETDQLDLERAPRDTRAATADRLNECIALALADLLRQGVAEARGRAGGRN